MSSVKSEIDRDFNANWKLCHPSEGEDIVISGMAGRFPKSDDIYEFRDNLFNKVDLVSGGVSRWRPIHPEVPQRTGKINDIFSFDAGFFGVNHLQANNMEPLLRLTLERTFEAILDAGFHPSELVGTKTGVFIGTCFSETEKVTLHLNQNKNSHAILGSTRSMISHYVSYFFRLQGPSVITDTACSSSMYAIQNAYKSIREGICDMAIVGGACLCLHPIVSLQFARLGVLSMDGRCKVFDDKADGYARSETDCVIILQKSKDARRIYAHIVHSKLNSDGYKQQGITYPSSEMQQNLMKEIYIESGLNVTDVTFIEAHGTGTSVGDPQELNALSEVFLPNRKRPLHIGGVKSNLGHNEPAAAITSVVKVLIGMESGYIPPNINFSKPNESVEAIVKAQFKVVTEKMPWPDNNGIVGVNSFGFGGSNGHLVLRWNEKLKINDGLPNDELPRLICASARTKQALTTIWNDLSGRTLDAEFIKLLHTVFRRKIPNHLFRGYQILNKSGEIVRSVSRVRKDKPTVVWVFSNFSSTWPAVGKQLITIPLFSEFLEKIQDALNKVININLADLLSKFERENLLNQILGTTAVQICLIEIFKILGLQPDFVVGLGIGELIAAYYESQLSLDEVISASLFCGFAFCKEKDTKISEQSFVYQEMLNNLKNVISVPLAFYKRWLSLIGKNQNCSKQGSPEYFAYRIASPNSFSKIKEFLSSETTILIFGEGPKGLCLVEESSENHVLNLLNNLGRIYEHGYDIQLDNLYPKVSWPVSRGTPMISPLIKWETNQNWFVGLYKNEHEITSGQRVIHVIAKENEWNFIKGHVIDGRNIFPATGYLTLVWETLGMITGKLVSDMKIIFENVKFFRAINLNNNDDVELIINIHIGEKRFEITEGGTVIATGKVYDVISTEDIVDVYDADLESEESYTLHQNDIYTKLRIRGYNYWGAFKELRQCNVGATKGLVAWTGNWISFMDNILQMMMLQMDIVDLYIPTVIKQVIIDAPKHMEFVSKLGGKGALVPTYANQTLDSIRSGAIEFRGVKVNAIVRRKRGIPLLETYKFISNVAKLQLEQSIRVLIQVILENRLVIKLKSVELAGDSHLLSPLMNDVFGDLPLIQAETVVLSSNTEQVLPNTKFENKSLSTQTNVLVVIVTNAFTDDVVIDSALNAVKDTSGFVIARENIDFDISNVKREDLDVLCVYTTEYECLILLRKSSKYKKPIVVEISDGFNWLPIAKETVNRGDRLILCSQNLFTSGILGLVNCLRREPNGTNVSCFYIVDDAPEFDPDNPFYAKQIQKNLAINVWKRGTWGTYRHLLLEDNSETQCDHCYANVTVRGDLSSIKYVEGYLHKDYESGVGKILTHIYFAALNFRDVMTATGRIFVETITKDRALQECIQGIEFSGRDVIGKRVMGMAKGGCLATHVEADSHFVWPMPEDWSMEEAATIPIAYCTVIYALLMRAPIKRGQSILIHSATGGVGQAAINIALYFGCDIFVTVGTQEKRDYLLTKYPQIKEKHIGNSHDTSFEQMIQVCTDGRGVDFVLNSLAEEKLMASIRCVARNGNFIEIGKFDLESDTDMQMLLFERGANFHGVVLDGLIQGRAEVKYKLGLHIQELIQDGAIKPLHRTVFKKSKIIDAFKYMTLGKHVGKVLVKMREEEHERICSVQHELFEGLPRFHCATDGTYIILGGLGGFGLQLADWLAMRRVQKLILTSRTGISTGYQAMMFNLWKSYGIDVVVRTDDVTTREGCAELINYANSLGPVKGVFNLAAILRDGLFENQSMENFEISFAPKAIATQHLDNVTREMCPELRQFVMFSSISCGRGNAGQTNYGMANSVMERICEQRRAEGYPALAIQWGAIGDVGLVAEMKDMDLEQVIGGTLQQRISSCLQTLDNFLKQDEVIVGSMIVAQKSALSSATNIVDAVLRILGVSDLKKISLHTTFPELGMDSMMGVEIKQTLEREYEVFLSAQEIRTMSLAKLQKISKGELKNQGTSESSTEEKQLSDDITLLLQHIADEESSYEPIVEMGDYVQKEEFGKIYLLPGIEGTVIASVPLIKNLKMNVACLQYYRNIGLNKVEDLAKVLLPSIDTKTKSFVLVAHSFGCVLATELARLLEMKDRIGKLVFIDGSPQMLAKMLKTMFDVSNDDLLETSILCASLSKYLPYHTVLKHKPEILRCACMKDRVRYCISVSPKLNVSEEYLTEVCMQTYVRIKAAVNYIPNYPKLRSKIKLIKPKRVSAAGINDDYGLSSLFQDTVSIETFEGDHLSIMTNPDVAQTIRKFIEYGI